jgi:hypothetical protein
MILGALDDLTVARPHEPIDARFTAAEFAVYRAGYDTALTVATKTVVAAAQRFELFERTKRIEQQQQRREKERAPCRDSGKKRLDR